MQVRSDSRNVAEITHKSNAKNTEKSTPIVSCGTLEFACEARFES